MKSQEINKQVVFRTTKKTNLVETAMEDFLDFISFKGDCLKISFVVVVEER